MKLKYLGHACFLLTNAAGETLLMDPFDPTMGYPVPNMPVDTVTMSHGHHDHNYVEALPDGYQTIDEAGFFTTGDYTITGIESYHDDVNGSKRGTNILFVVEADGVRVAHLGDLGHPLTDETLARMGEIDVLLLPVGGFYTIDETVAAQVMRAVRPELTIPMHYKTGANDLPIASEKGFVQTNGGQYAAVAQIDITKESLAKGPKILVLKHPE